ncbi:hypothetical protein D3C81_1191060 [compost metagenome]
MAHAEGACDQRVAFHTTRPGFGQCAGQGKQHRAPCQRLPVGSHAYAATAGVHDQCAGIQQRLYLIDAQRVLDSCTNAASGRLIQPGAGFIDLGLQCGNARISGRNACALKRRASFFDLQPAQCQRSRGQVGHCGQRGRHRPAVEPREDACGLLQFSEQQQAARQDQPRLQRVGMITARFENRCDRQQGARGAAEFAHGQRHFGFCQAAACACQYFMRPKPTPRTSQQFTCTRQFAELGHGDSAQGQRGRIVAQRNVLEGSKNIAGGKGTRGGGGQGVHRDRLPACVGVRIWA